jgi:hypothetical protein
MCVKQFLRELPDPLAERACHKCHAAAAMQRWPRLHIGSEIGKNKNGLSEMEAI